MWFQTTYTFLGGLGIFFFGMKTLSDALQALAGDFIRRVIRVLTTNRFMAVAVGTLVTTIVQSSSVTTVMVVGLVNAGLMQLTQAIGVIFGANIGTTITGWIIAIKVGKYGLLFVGLGIFPLLFAKRDIFKHIGRFLVAIGFVFLGLKFMGGALKPLKDTETFVNIMQYYQADSFLSLLACVATGAILTFIVQSSSAMLGVTIALASTGAISFQTAVGLVLGENIGTTITALLACIGANTNAKRAARAHALFNVLGVCVLVPLFWFYTDFVDWVIGGDPDALDADGSKPNIASHIAAAHTIFNVVNVGIFIWLIKPVARLVTILTPAPKRKEELSLKYLSTGAMESVPLAISAAEKELEALFEVVSKMLKKTQEYVLAERVDGKLRQEIRKAEELTDTVQGEVTVFLYKAQKGLMTFEQTSRAHSIIRAADELEKIGDYCEAISRYSDRLSIDGEKERMTQEAQRDLAEIMSLVQTFFDSVRKTLKSDAHWDIDELAEKSRAIKVLGRELHERHRVRLEKKKCTPLAAMVFSDVVVSLRKIRGHILNIGQFMAGRYDAEDV